MLLLFHGLSAPVAVENEFSDGCSTSPSQRGREAIRNDEKICFIITVFEVYDAVTASGRK